MNEQTTFEKMLKHIKQEAPELDGGYPTTKELHEAAIEFLCREIDILKESLATRIHFNS